MALATLLCFLSTAPQVHLRPGTGAGDTGEAVARAIAEARKLPPPERAVFLHGGDWILQGSLVLTAADSGLRLEAAPGTRPRLAGGVLLHRPPLERVTDPVLLARLPEAARESVRVVALPPGHAWAGPVHRGMGLPTVPVATGVVWDGRPLTLARWPNTGWARVAEVLDPGSIPRNRAPDIPAEQRETGPPRGGTFRPEVPAERLRRWQRATGLWAQGWWHWDWADEQLPVAAVDADAPGGGTIRLGLPHRYGLRAGTIFRVLGVPEELDAPGEFWLDAEHDRLYLVPPAAAVSGSPEELLLTTLTEPLLRIEGAADVVLRGLSFLGGRGPAVEARDVRGLLVEDCRVLFPGTLGIRVDGAGNRVRRCEVGWSGGGGISLAGGDRPTLTPAGNVLEDSHIHHFGRLYRSYHPAVGLGGVGQVVRRNHLHDAPHAAILFGGNDHRIEGNDIHDVLLETGDCGAIYCGRDWTMHGTVIRGNFLHDLPGTADRWQNGVYLDDMASGITVEGNLFLRCNLGMLVGGGRDLRIRGNVFLRCNLGLRFDSRGTGWMAPHIADPKTSTILQRYAALPVDRPPWSTRFPSLQHYLEDRFGRPAGSVVAGNLFLATPFGAVADREAVRVAGNVVLDS